MQEYNKKIETVLTEDCQLIGTLKFNKAIQIHGKIKGQIDAPEGYILVGATGELDAEITIKNINNKGKIKGNVKAIDTVYIYKSSTIEGNINTKKLVIEKGGQLNGLCIMKNNEENIDQPKKDTIKENPNSPIK